MAKIKRVMTAATKLTNKEQKLVNRVFNEAMEYPIRMPSEDFATVEARFKAENADLIAQIGDNRPVYLEHISAFIASLAGFEGRLHYVQTLDLPDHVTQEIATMIAHAFMGLIQKHYPELNPAYVAPVKEFDPFNL
jgi:hypothetical protein